MATSSTCGITRQIVLAALLFSMLNLQRSTFAQGSTFTYQGWLNDGGNPANGSYVFRFSLDDGNNVPVGSPATTPPLDVTNGLFTVTLDFGPGIFTNANRRLGIEVHTNDNGSPFVALTPPQPILPAPFAIYAESVDATGIIGIVRNSTNFAGPLLGDVTGTQGATLVSKVGGQLAANVSSGVIAANAATSDNVANTIVKRDGAGGFAAGTVTLNGALTLPATTSTAGIIYSGGSTLLHAFGTENFFAGPAAGNLATTGFGFNTGIGGAALHNNTTGGLNTANGSAALYFNTTGGFNTANGTAALEFNTSGSYNTANGALALIANTTGDNNTANGYSALQNNSSGHDNTANGLNALANNTTGDYNTANGALALVANTTGNYNTANGDLALYLNTTGNENIALGAGAASNLTTGDRNIDIGNPGVTAESGTIRIGTPGMHTRTFFAGISGATAASGVAVYVNSSGQLGTLPSSARFKQDIRSMDDASDVLLSLRPVAFRYKPEVDSHGLPQFGLVAEEVEKVNPGLVARDAQNQVYTVRYEAVNAMLLNEFLKQHRKVEEQNTEIQDLQKKLGKLEAMVEQLAAQK